MTEPQTGAGQGLVSIRIAHLPACRYYKNRDAECSCRLPETVVAIEAQAVEAYLELYATEQEAIVRAAAVQPWREALLELSDGVGDVMGTLNFYAGPNARTAVSQESKDRFNRIAAALKDARALLNKEPE